MAAKRDRSMVQLDKAYVPHEHEELRALALKTRALRPDPASAGRSGQSRTIRST